MNEEKLLKNHAGYSDDQLVELILQGAFEAKKEQYIRVLRVRRRKILEDVVGISRDHVPLPDTQKKCSKNITPDIEYRNAVQEKTSGCKSTFKKGCISLLIFLLCFLIAALIYGILSKK
jgi:hypothetical protein